MAYVNCKCCRKRCKSTSVLILSSEYAGVMVLQLAGCDTGADMWIICKLLQHSCRSVYIVSDVMARN